MTEQIDQQPTRKSMGRGRGFLSMTKEQRTEAARKGGIAAHVLGTAHKWDSLEAQAAGRKGGSVSRRGRKRLTPEELEARRQIILDGNL